mmetsp:Transcript_37608/g.118772  ORF Transcript_37608/g.118772 Transcript_37608/m.118772 type:complete len:264 (+) Transcript_37608:1075-1866(+)
MCVRGGLKVDRRRRGTQYSFPVPTRYTRRRGGEAHSRQVLCYRCSSALSRGSCPVCRQNFSSILSAGVAARVLAPPPLPASSSFLSLVLSFTTTGCCRMFISQSQQHADRIGTQLFQLSMLMVNQTSPPVEASASQVEEAGEPMPQLPVTVQEDRRELRHLVEVGEGLEEVKLDELGGREGSSELVEDVLEEYAVLASIIVQEHVDPDVATFVENFSVEGHSRDVKKRTELLPPSLLLLLPDLLLPDLAEDGFFLLVTFARVD